MLLDDVKEEWETGTRTGTKMGTGMQAERECSYLKHLERTASS